GEGGARAESGLPIRRGSVYVAPMTATAPAMPLEKPRLRGLSHQVAAMLAPVATLVLVASAETTASATAAAVFGATATLLFTISATYHRVSWSPVARARMRRLDHAVIFIMIAGGYTPLFLLI